MHTQLKLLGFHVCISAHITHLQAAADAKALLEAHERADLLQRMLDEEGDAAREALRQAQQ